MANSIEDITKQEKERGVANPHSNKNVSSLDTIVSSANRKISSAAKALLTGSIVTGTYGLVGRSSLLTAGGNGIGYLIEKAKAKDPIKENELFKEVATGGILGTLGYALYSLIDFIPNYSLPLKIAKTLAFNPLMLAPYVAFYQAFTYLRDKVGIGKSISGLLNLKIFKYLRDAYRNEIKPNFYKSMKKIMYLMPIHFASINYVTEIWKRVAIGVFNDIAFRLFQSKKGSADAEYRAKNSAYYGMPTYQTA